MQRETLRLKTPLSETARVIWGSPVILIETHNLARGIRTLRTRLGPPGTWFDVAKCNGREIPVHTRRA